MHEMGIALEIIDIVKASIPADMPDAAVARVNLKVGKLSAIVPESLRFCFGVAVKDTQLDGADLNIEEVPVVIRCEACHQERIVTEPVFSCAACGSGQVTLVSGKELDIVSIELAEEDV